MSLCDHGVIKFQLTNSDGVFAMRSGIPPRSDYTAGDLRALARGAKDTKQSRRLLALPAVAEDRSRAEATRLGGMDRQSLRDRVPRFNTEGLGV